MAYMVDENGNGVGLAGAGHRAAQRADDEDDPAVVDGRSGD